MCHCSTARAVAQSYTRSIHLKSRRASGNQGARGGGRKKTRRRRISTRIFREGAALGTQGLNLYSVIRPGPNHLRSRLLKKNRFFCDCLLVYVFIWLISISSLISLDKFLKIELSLNLFLKPSTSLSKKLNFENNTKTFNFILCKFLKTILIWQEREFMNW